MTTITQLQDDAYDYVTRMLPAREVRFEDLDYPQASTPYVTIKLTVTDDHEHDLITYNETGDEQVLRGLSSVQVRLSCWDGDAQAAANRLQKGLRSDEAIYDAFKNGGRGAINSINDISTAVNSRIEPRSEFAYTIHAPLSETVAVHTFTDLELDGTMVGINHPAP